MCKAVDVASYLLQEKSHLSGCQLQGLLSYSQAWCLVTQGRPLFSESVRAWDHGPVVYEVFREHVRASSVVQTDVSGDFEALTSEDMAVIDAVLDSYGSVSERALEDLWQHEDPWREATDGTSSAHSPVITEESMMRYYAALMSSDRRTREDHHVPQFAYAPRMFVSDAEYDWLASIA